MSPHTPDIFQMLLESNSIYTGQIEFQKSNLIIIDFIREWLLMYDG